jgi:hypothetical protein
MRESEFHAAIADEAVPLPHPRFAVYRNNVRAALTNALRVRYPQTARALGEATFKSVAGEFARRHRPASAVLIAYGGEFPEFVAAAGLASCPPWLADLARVESAWWQAYHAADADVLEPAALAALVPAGLLEAPLRLHPSLHLLALQTPAASRWQALIDGADDDLAPAPQFVLVARPAAEVSLRIIPPDTHDFLAALMRLRTIAAAAGEVLAGHPSFDLQSQFAALLSGRIICGVDL